MVEINLDQRTYNLFRAFAVSFGVDEKQAENHAVNRLLEVYDRYMDLTSKMRQLADAHSMTDVRRTRYS